MAQINPSDFTGHSKRKSHTSLTIDMTPMVDLGFLLISFFIFTTTMSEQRSTNLLMPKESLDSLEVKDTYALTAILGTENKIFVYEGRWADAFERSLIYRTNYHTQNGLGSFIRQKQEILGEKGYKLVLLIKPLQVSSYKNLVDALDETLVNSVSRYVIMEPTDNEKNYIAKL